jgi:hypothetical protein
MFLFIQLEYQQSFNLCSLLDITANDFYFERQCVTVIQAGND